METTQVRLSKDFLSLISHDLKNPFNALLGLTDLLDKRYNQFDDEGRIDLIRNINKSSKQLYQLIENMVLWLNLEAGRILDTEKPVSLREIISESISFFSSIIDEKKLDIIDNIEKCEMKTDFNLCSSLFWNLLKMVIDSAVNNSRIELKSLFHSSSVEVQMNYRGKEVFLGARDLDDPCSPDVFKSGGRVYMGMSLGVCKRLVDFFGGSLCFDSKEEDNSININLPFNLKSSGGKQ